MRWIETCRNAYLSDFSLEEWTFSNETQSPGSTVISSLSTTVVDNQTGGGGGGGGGGEWEMSTTDKLLSPGKKTKITKSCW